MLGFVGLGADAYHLLDRASAFLLDARLAARARGGDAPSHAARGDLWALGVSGDLPILCASVASRAQLPLAREAVRAHDFYRTMGVESDLVLINDYGNDYEQPVRDALRDMIAASHLREMAGARGGVHMLDGAQLTPAQRETLSHVAALSFAGGAGFHAQLRARLAALEFGGRAAYRPMEARAVKLPPIQRALFTVMAALRRKVTPSTPPNPPPPPGRTCWPGRRSVCSSPSAAGASSLAKTAAWSASRPSTTTRCARAGG